MSGRRQGLMQHPTQLHDQSPIVLRQGYKTVWRDQSVLTDGASATTFNPIGTAAYAPGSEVECVQIRHFQRLT